MADQRPLLPGPWLRPHGTHVYNDGPEAPEALPYAEGSDTSEEASRRALPRAGTDARRILDLIILHRGMTCYEVEQVTGLEHQTASARINGLKRGGWIRDSGERRPTGTGSPAIVWEAT